MLNLLQRITENDILLKVVDGKLKLLSSSQEIAPGLLDEIKANKEEIISYLMTSQSVTSIRSSITACGEKECYSLSRAQYRIWVLSQFNGGSEVYNMPFSLNLCKVVCNFLYLTRSLATEGTK